MHRYCLVQYSFKSGIERPLSAMPHGNAKHKDSEYVRTWESTKSLLKDATVKKKPREAIHHVVGKEIGGIRFCSGIGQLPRDRQQANYFRRIKSNSGGFVPVKNMSGEGKEDPWYGLLKESKIQAKKRSTAFIRDVRVGGEPLCVLATDRQLDDIVRFCCSTAYHKPLTVDPTFDIGKFNVTPISYQHLMLENVKDGNHPTLIGPILIHERKTEDTYSMFCGSLKALQPEISNILAFGTDDEQALTNAFNKNFERAIHLLCEIHLKKNVERKLIDLGITAGIKDEIQADIFGKTTADVFESGLSDAESEEDFFSKLSILKSKWVKMHDGCNDFYDWFNLNKASEFVNSVINPVRKLAGLGCPPEKFNTNRSERTNGIIQDFVKRECSGSKVNEYIFALTMQKLIDVQEKEIELAVVNRGEYNLREGFKHLSVPPSRWSSMTEKQRAAALKKIHSFKLEDVAPGITTAATQAISQENNTLMTTMLTAGIDWIPHDVLQGITNKALRIKDKITILEDSELLTAIVPSKSNPKKPHIVVFNPNGKCECQDCPNYSALSVCAHAIAASVKTGCLNSYVTWLLTKKRKTGGINYSKAILHGLPNDRGRKPGRMVQRQ